jgi:hypothetical protein
MKSTGLYNQTIIFSWGVGVLTVQIGLGYKEKCRDKIGGFGSMWSAPLNLITLSLLHNHM